MTKRQTTVALAKTVKKLQARVVAVEKKHKSTVKAMAKNYQSNLKKLDKQHHLNLKAMEKKHQSNLKKIDNGAVAPTPQSSVPKATGWSIESWNPNPEKWANITPGKRTLQRITLKAKVDPAFRASLRVCPDVKQKVDQYLEINDAPAAEREYLKLARITTPGKTKVGEVMKAIREGHLNADKVAACNGFWREHLSRGLGPRPYPDEEFFAFLRALL